MASLSPPIPSSPYPNSAEEEDSLQQLRDAVPQLEGLFVVQRCIGHGTFSSVYLGRTKHTTTINGRHHFALKHIIPTSHPSRIYMELKCLKMIGGQDNVMGVTMCLRQVNHIVLVMPYFPHDNFADYVGKLKVEELQHYLVNLLRALRRVHSYSIIHRDVKPANFLYNRAHRRYALVDFGLAQEVGGACSRPTPTNSTPPLHTPASTNSRTVKRKLSVAVQECPNKKRKGVTSAGCVGSPATVLSSTCSRLNTTLRRSPRKQMPSTVSPRKENIELIKKWVKSSPSKTICHRLLQGAGAEESSRSEAEGLRRSPRKPASSRRNIQPPPAAPLPSTTPKSNSKIPTLDMKKHREMGESSGWKKKNGTETTTSPHLNLTPAQQPKTCHAIKNNRVLQEVVTGSGSVLRPVSCQCYGHPRLCAVCLGRSQQVAPRAGTPGFRAPEVLLRHPHQGTAVDMWSVGVVLLCLLSGRYPFFKAPDDLSTLAEVITLLGTQAVRKAAAKLGKLVTCSEECPPVELMAVCEVLHNRLVTTSGIPVPRACTSCHQTGACVCQDLHRKQEWHHQEQHKSTSYPRVTGTTARRGGGPDLKVGAVPGPFVASRNAGFGYCTPTAVSGGTAEHQQTKCAEGEGASYPPEVYHLLARLLDPCPDTRITADQALAHSFLLGKC